MEKYVIGSVSNCDVSESYDNNHQWAVYDNKNHEMTVVVTPHVITRSERVSGVYLLIDEPMNVVVKRALKGQGVYVSYRLAHFLQHHGFSVRNMK